MELLEAKKLCRYLMNKHLKKYNWYMDLDNSKTTFGYCYYNESEGEYKIVLSKAFIFLNSIEQVKETILHEIAHAIDVENRGYSKHDKNWLKIAAAIGSNCEVYCTKKVIRPKTKYTTKCNNCGDLQPLHRKSKTVSACFDCCEKYNKGEYSNKFDLEIIQNY